jgi:UDP-glucose 4-epimerase
VPSAAGIPGDLQAFYRQRRVMVTGGMGFIGSNLTRRLVELGADVLVVDAMIPDYGGNTFNLHGMEDAVHLHLTDIRLRSAMDRLVPEVEIIFNLAGQVSHIDSMQDPHTDLDINCRAQLSLLEACRRHNPGVKVVFAGTRQIYGRPERLPVDETHLVRPTDVNGINKAAGESYHLVYNNVFGVRACSLRLTNVYGPRQLLKHNRQGFIGWFIRLAIEGREIQIYGDGTQLRDFVFVDDAADAFLRAGATDACNGSVFNIGGSEPVSHVQLVQQLVAAAGSGSYRLVPWPADKKAIDIGDFYSDSSRMLGATGWAPTTPLAVGLARTLDFYRAHFEHYVPAASQVGATCAAAHAFPSSNSGPGATTPRSPRRSSGW